SLQFLLLSYSFSLHVLSLCPFQLLLFSFFLFTDTTTTEIYTLSLHDALPILFQFARQHSSASLNGTSTIRFEGVENQSFPVQLRSEEHTSEPSHVSISYAVFCLKKKK